MLLARLALAGVSVALPALASAQANIHVDASAAPGGDGSPTAPFQTLQEGADAALDGDRLVVATGTYAPFVTGTIVDVFGAGAVLVDASLAPSLVGCAIGTPGAANPTDVSVENVDFTGGGAAPSQGLRVTTSGDVRIVACSFADHDMTGSFGGGLHLDGSLLVVEDCDFTGNVAERGGGLYVSDLAAGTVVGSTLRVTGSRFVGHDLRTAQGPGGQGAAIYAYLFSTPATVEDSSFVGNAVPTVVLDSSGGLIADSTFVGNIGALDAALVQDDLAFGSQFAPRMTGCVLRGRVRPDGAPVGQEPVLVGVRFEDGVVIGQPNGFRAPLLRGNGASLEGTVVFATDSGTSPLLRGVPVRSCTFLRTRSGPVGMFAEDPFSGGMRVNSSIVEGHEGPIGTATFEFSRIPGGAPGPFNIDDDPELFAGLAGDARLGVGSPCIDAGDPALTDPDGSRADMGARPWSAGQAPPGGRAYCVGTEASAGGTPGLAVPVGPSFQSMRAMPVTATGLPPSSFGLFFVGPAGRAPWTLGGGLPLCVGPMSERTPVVAVDATGTLSASLSPGTLSLIGFGPGDHVFVQCIARDLGNANGIVLSDAVQVLIED